MEFLSSPELASQATALGQVLLMDLVLAGDNAVAVGLAAAGRGSKRADRRRPRQGGGERGRPAPAAARGAGTGGAHPVARPAVRRLERGRAAVRKREERGR